MPENTQHTNIFIAHAPDDSAALKTFLSHLKALEPEAKIWSTENLTAGTEHEKIKQAQLQQADIVLLLVSSTFIASEAYEALKNTLETQDKKQIIPILLSPYSWKDEPFLAERTALPRDEKAIKLYRSKAEQNKAWTGIVEELKEMINPEYQRPKPIEPKPVEPKPKSVEVNSKGNAGNIEGNQNIIIQDSEVNIGVPKTDAPSRKIPIVIAVLIALLVVVGLVWWNTPESDSPSIEEIPSIYGESIFTPEDTARFKVLILRFEDYIAKEEENCIGTSIRRHFVDLEINKKLPITSVYANSIYSPEHPDEAQALQEHHNADVLIYGIANEIQENCSGANVCFRHFVADDIMGNVDEPESTVQINHSLEYKKTSPIEIEQGKLSVDEKSMEAWVSSLIALKDNDTQTAFAEIVKMVGNLSGLSDEEKASRYYNQGLIFYDLKEYDKAILSFDKAIELNPKYDKAYNNRGNAYRHLKEYKKAIKDYDKAIELDPNLAEAYSNRGVAYSNLQEYKKAIKDYDKAIELDPNLAEAYNNRGIAYRLLKEYKKAIKSYDKAIELNPNYALAYNNRGIAYYSLKEYKKAIKDYDKAIELNPNLAEAYSNRGAAYSDLKEYKKAIKDYDKAIELDPNLAEAYNNRGVVYGHLKEYKKAIKDYDKAIELNPKDAEAYYNRGVAYDDLKEYKKAIKDYDKAIELNPNLAEAYSNRGIAYRHLKEYKKAIKDYDKAIELNPNLAVAYYNRGNAYRKLKNYEKSIADNKKAISLKPTFGEAYVNLVYSYTLNNLLLAFFIVFSLVFFLLWHFKFRKTAS